MLKKDNKEISNFCLYIDFINMIKNELKELLGYDPPSYIVCLYISNTEIYRNIVNEILYGEVNK